MEDDTDERAIEEQIEKLNSEIEEITAAIEALGIAKEQTETKLKDEIKKARDLNKWKKRRIDRNSSQTLEMLNLLSTLYDQMYDVHENCELNNKTQDIMENYKSEFDGLIRLYERMVVGFLKPTQKRYGCPCQIQMDQGECNNVYNESVIVDDCFNRSFVESFLEKKRACQSYEELDEEGEEEEEEESMGKLEQ